MELLRLLDGDEGGHEKAPHARFGRIQFPSKVGDLCSYYWWRVAARHYRRYLRCFLITELMDGQGRGFRVGSPFRCVMVRRSSKFHGLGRLAFRGGKMAYYGQCRHGHDVVVLLGVLGAVGART